MPTTTNPTRSLTVTRPFPTEWETAADSVAGATGSAPIDATDNDYVDRVVGALDRLPVDDVTRLALSREEIFSATLDKALDSLQSGAQRRRRRASSAFLGESSDLPQPERLAKEVAATARTDHRENVVRDAVGLYAARVGATSAAKREAMVRIIVTDAERERVELDEPYMRDVLERWSRAEDWKASRAKLEEWYPPDDARAKEILDQWVVVPPVGSATPPFPKSAGSPDPVGASFMVAEAKLEDVATRAQLLTRAATIDGCPQVDRPCDEDDDIDDRICAAATTIQILLLGERGLVLAAVDEARRQFRARTLGVRSLRTVRDELYFRDSLTYQGSLDVVSTDQRNALYRALGLLPEVSAGGNAASYAAFMQLIEDLNAYTAARCEGRRCGRAAWVKVRISIRQVRSRIATALGDEDVVMAAALVRYYNSQLALLGRLNALMFPSAGAGPGVCIEVWPVIRTLVPNQARDVDNVNLGALADAWQAVMALVAYGDGALETDLISDAALDAAALIRLGFETRSLQP